MLRGQRCCPIFLLVLVQAVGGAELFVGGVRSDHVVTFSACTFVVSFAKLSDAGFGAELFFTGLSWQNILQGGFVLSAPSACGRGYWTLQLLWRSSSAFCLVAVYIWRWLGLTTTHVLGSWWLTGNFLLNFGIYIILCQIPRRFFNLSSYPNKIDDQLNFSLFFLNFRFISEKCCNSSLVSWRCGPLGSLKSG